MKKPYLAVGLFLTLSILAGLTLNSYAQEAGITTVKTESEVVSIPPGKTVSVTSKCTPGKALISGGGVCLGFMGTENKVMLNVSAPSPDAKNSWFVVCTNMSENPGEAQAMSWALCADPEALEPDEKK